MSETSRTKERICEALEPIREQNPTGRVLFVLDDLYSHTFEYTHKRATRLGIGLVFSPVGSPDLNPTGSGSKCLKGEASPMIGESADGSALSPPICSSDRVSFAGEWTERLPNLQKLY